MKSIGNNYSNEINSVRKNCFMVIIGKREIFIIENGAKVSLLIGIIV